jgi:hypothetical protein
MNGFSIFDWGGRQPQRPPGREENIFINKREKINPECEM